MYKYIFIYICIYYVAIYLVFVLVLISNFKIHIFDVCIWISRKENASIFLRDFITAEGKLIQCPAVYKRNILYGASFTS